MPFRLEISGNYFQLVNNPGTVVLGDCYPSNRVKFKLGTTENSLIFIGNSQEEVLYPSNTAAVPGAANQLNREFLLSELLDSAGDPWDDLPTLIQFIKDNTAGFSGAAATGPGIGLSQTSIAQYDDGQYTQAAPLTVLAMTDTQVPNDSAVTFEPKLIPNQVKPYDGLGNFAAVENQMFTLSIFFRASPMVPPGFLYLYFRSQAPAPVRIAEQTMGFATGAGGIERVEFTFNIRVSAAFAANGGELFAFSDFAFDLWDVRYHLSINN